MPSRLGKIFIIILGLVLVLTPAACGTSATRPTGTPTQDGLLTPYHTPTPSVSPTLAPQSTVTPTHIPSPTPTPTPFLHILRNDDTLLSLAFLYGVSLEAIKTANPGVDSRFLTVGKAIVIPIQATPAPTAVPTPTPIPVQVGEPRGYSTQDGGLWCFLLVTNPYPLALESLSTPIRILDPEGQTLAEQIAIPPLNLLPAGQSIPLAVFFPPPIPPATQPRAEPPISLFVSPNDTRYLDATVQVSQIKISADGLLVDISGTVSLPTGSPPASLVWVAVVAYDAGGNVVGLRRWESLAGISPQTPLTFTTTVYSLGPAIARIEAFVEARP
jgi:hypothetical protein